MAKILFINIPSHGHVNPTLAVVKELVDRGNEVVYCVDEPLKSKVEAVGAKVRNGIGLPLGYNAMRNISNNPEMIAERMLKFLKGMLDFSENLINLKESFDCVIFDSTCFFGKELGKRLNIKTVCSHTTFAINKEMLQEFMKGKSANMDKILALLKENEEVQTLVHKCKELLDIDFSGILQFQFGSSKPDLSIVYSSRLLQPYADSFDESYKFVGPSINDRREEPCIKLDFGEDEKIVYISLGTIYNESLDFYLACFQAFKDTEYKFIMSIGNKIDIKSLGAIPENFAVYNYVPQLEILKKAKVFITHGGMNSTSEGLYFGIPLIIIPQEVDQPVVARQVEKMGACIVLDKNNITPHLLKTSLDKIFKDESYKNNAMIIREDFMKRGGYKKAADKIMGLIDD